MRGYINCFLSLFASLPELNEKVVNFATGNGLLKKGVD